MYRICCADKLTQTKEARRMDNNFISFYLKILFSFVRKTFEHIDYLQTASINFFRKL